MQLTRRAALGALAARPGYPQTPDIDPAIVERHDSAVERYLKLQVTDRTV
jgi:hypothetical protein